MDSLSKKIINVLFVVIFFISPIRNSVFVRGLLLDSILNVSQLIFLMLVFAFYYKSLPKINTYLTFFILILGLYVFTLGDGYFRFLSLLLLVPIYFNVITQRTLLVISNFYFAFIGLVFLMFFFDLYEFSVTGHNKAKGLVVALGFKNANVYTFYLFQSLLVYYILNKKKLLYSCLTFLLVTVFYSKTRSVVLVILVSFLLMSLINFIKKISPYTRKVLMYLSILLIIVLAYSLILSADAIKDITLEPLLGTDITLNQLSSYRLLIITKVFEEFTFINWFLGSPSTGLEDSIYLFIISKYGLLISILFFVLIILKAKYYIYLDRNKELIIIFMFLLYGIFEMLFSPFSLFSLMFLSLIFYNKYNSNDKRVYA